LPPKSTRTELQDVVYDAAARIRTAIGLGRTDEALELADEIRANAEKLSTYREPLALAAEVLAGAGRLDGVEELAEAALAHPTDAGAAYLDQIEGLLASGRGEHEQAATSFGVFVAAAADAGYPLVELRGRGLRAGAWAAAGRLDEAAAELRAVVDEADRAGARAIAGDLRRTAAELDIELPPAPDEPRPEAREAAVMPQGERLVTSLFADVRGYSELGESLAPSALAERVAMLYRLARVAVERRGGIIDKFAGDAVMATFNVAGTSTEHTVAALDAALSLRDRAAMIELPLGIGIAVGPGVVGRGVGDDNIAVTGEATNLAARLQAQAGAGEILLSAEGNRRAADWLVDHGMETTREQLELKGFAEPQVVHRLAARSAVGMASR
ncbi:MAG TPA: adenylate/guanylate cyclase domain-containing protein, partial [Solirubrobacterales bacterium]|nr:adenylate/guanylate cyclase domain-containing protein [Solirubrobacterales bacterium]